MDHHPTEKLSSAQRTALAAIHKELMGKVAAVGRQQHVSSAATATAATTAKASVPYVVRQQRRVRGGRSSKNQQSPPASTAAAAAAAAFAGKTKTPPTKHHVLTAQDLFIDAHIAALTDQSLKSAEHLERLIQAWEDAPVKIKKSYKALAAEAAAAAASSSSSGRRSKRDKEIAVDVTELAAPLQQLGHKTKLTLAALGIATPQAVLSLNANTMATRIQAFRHAQGWPPYKDVGASVHYWKQMVRTKLMTRSALQGNAANEVNNDCATDSENDNETASTADNMSCAEEEVSSQTMTTTTTPTRQRFPSPRQRSKSQPTYTELSSDTETDEYDSDDDPDKIEYESPSYKQKAAGAQATTAVTNEQRQVSRKPLVPSNQYDFAELGPTATIMLVELGFKCARDIMQADIHSYVDQINPIRVRLNLAPSSNPLALVQNWRSRLKVILADVAGAAKPNKLVPIATTDPGKTQASAPQGACAKEKSRPLKTVQNASRRSSGAPQYDYATLGSRTAGLLEVMGVRCARELLTGNVEDLSSRLVTARAKLGLDVSKNPKSLIFHWRSQWKKLAAEAHVEEDPVIEFPWTADPKFLAQAVGTSAAEQLGEMGIHDAAGFLSREVAELVLLVAGARHALRLAPSENPAGLVRRWRYKVLELCRQQGLDSSCASNANLSSSPSPKTLISTRTPVRPRLMASLVGDGARGGTRKPLARSGGLSSPTRNRTSTAGDDVLRNGAEKTPTRPDWLLPTAAGEEPQLAPKSKRSTLNSTPKQESKFSTIDGQQVVFYIKPSNPPKRSGEGMFVRPRGSPPKGCVWDEGVGEWAKLTAPSENENNRHVNPRGTLGSSPVLGFLASSSRPKVAPSGNSRHGSSDLAGRNEANMKIDIQDHDVIDLYSSTEAENDEVISPDSHPNRKRPPGKAKTSSTPQDLAGSRPLKRRVSRSPEVNSPAKKARTEDRAKSKFKPCGTCSGCIEIENCGSCLPCMQRVEGLKHGTTQGLVCALRICRQPKTARSPDKKLAKEDISTLDDAYAQKDNGLERYLPGDDPTENSASACLQESTPRGALFDVGTSNNSSITETGVSHAHSISSNHYNVRDDSPSKGTRVQPAAQNVGSAHEMLGKGASRNTASSLGVYSSMNPPEGHFRAIALRESPVRGLTRISTPSGELRIASPVMTAADLARQIQNARRRAASQLSGRLESDEDAF